MNETYVVTGYVVIDDILKAYGYEEHCRATSSASEIVTVAVMTAKYFQNHHERALYVMGYVKTSSLSLFNRRSHGLQDWLEGLTEVCRNGEVFITDTLPPPAAARKSAGKPFVAIVPPKRKISLAGVYT